VQDSSITFIGIGKKWRQKQHRLRAYCKQSQLPGKQTSVPRRWWYVLAYRTVS